VTVAYGLTPTGFVAKTTDVVRQQVDASAIASFGASWDTSDASVYGEMAGIFCAAAGDAWGAAQGASACFDPDASTGAALDGVAALTGTFREPPKSSVVTLTLTGTPTTTVDAGSLVAATSTGAQFGTSANAIIASVAAWGASTGYTAGASGSPGAGSRVTNGGNVYLCIVSGTSAGSGGPTGTGSSIVDGGVTWQWLGAGTGAVDAVAASVDQGAIVGASGDITTIATPVGGWSNVVNLLDATLGAAVQTDASLRATRTAELSSSGAGTPDAIRAAVLKVSGVTTCTVFNNATSSSVTMDGDTMPPNSMEALVQGGADADIAAALFAEWPGGIAYAGTTSVTVTDSQGQPQVVQFSRPTTTPIYVTISVTVDATQFSSGGTTAIAEAIADWGNGLAVGRDAVAAALGAQAFTVPGVLDVPRSGSLGGTLIDTSASPSSDATVVIGSRHLATYDTSRIVVNVTDGSP
jgi:uncharacterized phage protein gp47/JayE